MDSEGGRYVEARPKGRPFKDYVVEDDGNQSFLWHQLENAVKTQIWIAVSICVLVAIVQEQTLPGDQPLPNSTRFSTLRSSRKRPFYRLSSHPIPKTICPVPAIS